MTIACCDLRDKENRVASRRRDILFTKQRVCKYRRRGEHGTLGDIAKVRREVGQVELTATVAKKSGVGSRDLSLMGKALRKRSHEVMKQCRISRGEILQADEPQQPGEGPHRI